MGVGGEAEGREVQVVGGSEDEDAGDAVKGEVCVCVCGGGAGVGVACVGGDDEAGAGRRWGGGSGGGEPG